MLCEAPAAAAEADEGDFVTVQGVRYFRTGDIGELVGTGQVRVIDRCAAHFKLAQGIWVSPERVEAALCGSALVAQLFVCASSLMSNVAAAVVTTP
jgi:long-chain acyl-CoA synthetase